MAARAHCATGVQAVLFCRAVRPGPACGGQTMAGVIKVTAAGEHALSACIDGQQVAMLDFSPCGAQATLNMLFVKPPFRHRGVARALMREILRRYAQVRWVNRGREWTRPTVRAVRPAPAA
ncbi:GNAT family N-acetyltransferase [Janthinobacterium lividum]|uniref:GNAT family N-acetyltransferase n=1 Tax=Janthinobacterium lividum TaxID=29581 RepID=UPI003D65BC54